MHIVFNNDGSVDSPNVILCNPSSRFISEPLHERPSDALGCISNAQDIEINFVFNSPTELSFRVYDPSMDNGSALDGFDVYEKIKNKRLLFLYGYGYFVITNVEDGFDGVVGYKDVSAKSCEYELSTRTIPYIDERGWLFYDYFGESSAERGIFSYIVENIPSWSIGYVSEPLKNIRRYFSDIDVKSSVLTFLINEVQTAYGCVFTFDNTNRVINVYSSDELITETDVFLSRDNLVRDMKITENSDSVFTALSVTGANNLPISPINPIGNNMIYDFSYFYEWMSSGLSAKVQQWTNDIIDELNSDDDDSYYNLNVELYTKLSDQVNAQAEIDRLTILKNMYERCRLNIITSSSVNVAESYNDVITQNGGQPVDLDDTVEQAVAFVQAHLILVEMDLDIAVQNKAVIDAEIEELNDDIGAIVSSLSMENYFTASENDELSSYIYEGSFSNEYIAINDLMTPSERLAQMKELYLSAAREISIVSSPSREFEIGTEDFLFQSSVPLEWIESINVGCAVNVRIDNDVAKLFLSSITVCFDDASVSMKFGSRVDKFDNKTLFENVLGSVSKSASSVNNINNTISPIKDGELEYLRYEVGDSKTASTESAIVSQDGAFVFDINGIIGRKSSDGYAGGYYPIQLKIGGTSITLTDNGWNERSISIGELSPSIDGEEYGVSIDAPVFLNGRRVSDIIPELVTYEQWMSMTPVQDKLYYVLAPSESSD